MNLHKKPTLETLLYLFSFLAAVCLRFIHLGALPLNDFESINALRALGLVNQQTASMGGQPGYVTLTAGLFSLFDATDLFARFIPALAGSLMALLPLLFRKQLGKNSALLFSFFLSFEPALIAASRTANGAMAAASFLLLGLGFFITRRSVPAGLFLGASFAFGGNIWLGLIGIICASLFYWLISDQKFSLGDQLRKLNPSEWQNFGLSFAASLIIISTGFFWHPRGISGAGLGLVDFIQGFKVQSLISVRTMLLAFLCTEFPVILLAGWSLIRGIVAKERFRFFLAIWALTAGILAVMRGGRETMDWMWALIPLWGLAGIGLAEIIDLHIHTERQDRLVTIIQLGLTIFLLVFSFLNLLSLLFNSYGDQQVIQTRLIGTLLPLGLLILITLLISWGWSAGASKNGLVGAFIGLLLLVTLNNSFKSAGAQEQSAADLWRPGAAVTESHWMIQQLEDISLWNHGERHGIDIQVINQDSPAMRWALRKFEKTTYNTQFSSITTPEAMIAPDFVEIGSVALYRGQNLTWQEMPSFSLMKATDWVKWMIYRQVPVDENRVILWARNDLFH